MRILIEKLPAEVIEVSIQAFGTAIQRSKRADMTARKGWPGSAAVKGKEELGEKRMKKFTVRFLALAIFCNAAGGNSRGLARRCGDE